MSQDTRRALHSSCLPEGDTERKGSPAEGTESSGLASESVSCASVFSCLLPIWVLNYLKKEEEDCIALGKRDTGFEFFKLMVFMRGPWHYSRMWGRRILTAPQMEEVLKVGE